MNEDETVNDDTLDIEEEETELEEVEETNEYEQDDTDWKAEAKKQKTLAENQRIRAEKAEKKAKTTKPESSTSLTTTDILALSRAQIDDADLDEVLGYAERKKISIKEALNSTVLKAILSSLGEERNSAQVVNTGATRRGSSAVSDERLLSDARKNIMPEKEGDLERLAILRIKNR